MNPFVSPKPGADEMAAVLMKTENENSAAAELGMYRWQWNRQSAKVDLQPDQILLNRYIQKAAGTPGSPVYNALNQLLIALVPKKLIDRIAMALNFAQIDDKVGGIVSTNVDFGISGFRVSAKDDETEDKVKEWNRVHKVWNTLLQGWNDLASCDNTAILFMKKTNALSVLPVQNLVVVPTYAVNTKTGRPEKRVFLKIPVEMRDYIRKVNRQSSNSKALKNIPKKWVHAAVNPNLRPGNDPIFPTGGYVELKEKDDEYVFIINALGKEDRLINPSMGSVFPSIQLRSFIQDGEFSVAYVNKYFIHQIKVGKKDAGGTSSIAKALRTITVNPADQTEILNKYASTVDKATVEVTNQDQEHVFHFPGEKLDFAKRYATPDERIEGWGRMSRMLLDGSGGSFASGLIYMKSYGAKVQRSRDLFEGFLEELYKLALDLNGLEVLWDKNYMKEARQILREVQAQMNYGMHTETMVNLLGYDWQEYVSDKEKTMPPEILAMKGTKNHWQYERALGTPYFEPRQGMSGDGDGDEGSGGGRPEDSGAQTDPTGAGQQDRAGQVTNGAVAD